MTQVYRPNHPLANENGMVDKRDAGPLVAAQDPRFYITSDTMDPVKHMGTGKMYDSKSRFRAETRALGLTEVGNDAAARRPGNVYRTSQADVVPDVKRAIQELNSR